MGRMWRCTGQSTGKTTIAFNCEAVDSEEEMVNTLISSISTKTTKYSHGYVVCSDSRSLR